MVFGLAFGSVECSYFSIKVHYFLCLTNTSLTGCHSIFFFYSNANNNFSKEGIKTLYIFLLFGQKKNISSKKNRMNNIHWIYSLLILFQTESISRCQSSRNLASGTYGHSLKETSINFWFWPHFFFQIYLWRNCRFD